MLDKSFDDLIKDLRSVQEAKLNAYRLEDFDGALECLLEERELHDELLRRAGRDED